VKVVLDTNVLVSGAFFSGPPSKILEAWRNGKVRLVISPEILDEYSRVGEALAERFPRIDIRPILELVTVNAEMVSAADAAEPICDDPDDDKFFWCAIAAACKVIVSGDKHLLAKSGYAGVQVLKPRDFVEKILS
jgi:putative PIN family toxin of toxin-antitoxin system